MKALELPGMLLSEDNVSSVWVRRGFVQQDPLSNELNTLLTVINMNGWLLALINKQLTDCF